MRIYRIADFAVPADDKIKSKESKKKGKYLDLAKETYRLWDMKVTVIPIVSVVPGTISKGLLTEIEDLAILGTISFSFNLSWIELLQIELFDHLTLCIYKICLQIIFLIYI